MINKPMVEQVSSGRAAPLQAIGALFSRASTRMTAIGVFFLTLLVYVTCPITNTYGDAIWHLPTAISLVAEGNTDLVEYQVLIDDNLSLGYTIRYVDRKPYNSYPVGTSLAAFPLVAVAQVAGKALLQVDIGALSQHVILFDLDKYIASFMVAAAAVVVYLIARLSLTNGRALLAAFIFACCTSALSTASRALWQHGPSMLALAVALYCLLLLRQPAAQTSASPARSLALAGFALAFAFIIRPTNALSVVVLTLYVALQYRRKLRYMVPFLCGAALISLPYFYLNLTIYWSPFPTDFSRYFEPTQSFATWAQAMAGHLVSPSRGLLVFSPVLLFSLAGVAIKWRSGTLSALDWGLLLILLQHWIVLSAFRNWYAGYSYGARYMADVLPYLIYFLVPVLQKIPAFSSPRLRTASIVLWVTIGVSLAIHLIGATNVPAQFWNSIPRSVDAQPSRVWDWSDAQFLRPFSTRFADQQPGPEFQLRLDFDEATRALEGEGWGNPEQYPDGTTFQWTVERDAVMYVAIPANQILSVEIGLLRAVRPDILESFAFDINGTPVPLARSDTTFTGDIPIDALHGDGEPDQLRFTVREVVSPQSLGENQDTRTLGVMVDFLAIFPRTALNQ